MSKKRKRNSNSPSQKLKQKEKSVGKKRATRKRESKFSSLKGLYKGASLALQARDVTDKGIVRKLLDLTVIYLVFKSIGKQNSLLENQAFWLDEIWRVDLILAPNLFNAFVLNPSSFTAITSPLFAIFTRLSTIVFGVSPNSIRLLLSVAAILLSLIIYWFFRKHSPFLAIALFYFFITNREIGYWTLEFKPFVFDALVVVVVFLGWFSLLNTEVASKKRYKDSSI